MYVHYGIQTHFSTHWSYTFLENTSEIQIDIGTDGASLFKSLKITIWPNLPNVNPFLIGCYCGKAIEVLV